jgi:hypothetical protein
MIKFDDFGRCYFKYNFRNIFRRFISGEVDACKSDTNNKPESLTSYSLSISSDIPLISPCSYHHATMVIAIQSENSIGKHNKWIK